MREAATPYRIVICMTHTWAKQPVIPLLSVMDTKMLPLYSCDVQRITHIRSDQDAEQALQELSRPMEVVSLDLEWSKNSNVDVIILATAERTLIIHLSAFSDLARSSTASEKVKVPDPRLPTLRNILEDRNILKVGVNIRRKCTMVSGHNHIAH